MIQRYEPIRVRFGSFELDLRTNELFKNGNRIKLQDQPSKLLTLLVTHPAELVTRGEIQKLLWEDQFVEVDHGINAAMKKIRTALDEDPDQPKFIETLAKKGYRFIAPVEEIFDNKPVDVSAPADSSTNPDGAPVPQAPSPVPPDAPFPLAIPLRLARFLYQFIQFGYLAMYCAALINMEGLGDALRAAGLEPVSLTLPLVLIVSMCGIAVRIYLITEVFWKHPAAGWQFRRLFPLLLVFDGMWAMSPLLVGRKIGFGLALAGVAGLAYLPFAQRTLMVTIAPEAFGNRGRRFPR